jgi:hypothetical protein
MVCFGGSRWGQALPLESTGHGFEVLARRAITSSQQRLSAIAIVQMAQSVVHASPDELAAQIPPGTT